MTFHAGVETTTKKCAGGGGGGVKLSLSSHTHTYYICWGLQLPFPPPLVNLQHCQMSTRLIMTCLLSSNNECMCTLYTKFKSGGWGTPLVLHPCHGTDLKQQIPLDETHVHTLPFLPLCKKSNLSLRKCHTMANVVDRILGLSH